MHHVVSDVPQLTDWLRERSVDQQPSIIGVDGTTGCGKTTIARQIAQTLNLEHVELDSVLEKHQGGYADYINYHELRRLIDRAAQFPRSIVVEGICLLKILDRIQVTPDILIYIKHVNAYGDWYDDRYYEPRENPQEAIHEFDSELSRLASRGKEFPADCEKEIIQYHQTYKPTVKADCVFLQSAL
ncbi:hypothetical protein HYR99_27935 [Candidatus Poribacteria bacterium]|nr:hypothetical protein [Candidatus Poribacteria bacterium]